MSRPTVSSTGWCKERPDGTTTTIASTPNGGQPYSGSYSISTGALTQVGTYTYTAYVYDSDDGTNATTQTVSVIVSGVANTPVIVTIPSSIIDVGQSETIGASVVNNTFQSPFTYLWKIDGNPISQSGSTITFFGNHSDLGTNNVSVSVADRNGRRGAGSGTVTVNPNLTANDITVSIPTSMIQEGTSEVVTAIVQGGAIPTSYLWSVNSNPISQTGRSITFYGNSTTVGNDILMVTVTDAAGESASASGFVLVTPGSSTTTISSGGGGGTNGCFGICASGSSGGRLQTTITTVKTTTLPTTSTVPPSRSGNTTTKTTSNQSGTPKSTTATQKTPGSLLAPPSLATVLFLVIIALLLVILALLLILGRPPEGEELGDDAVGMRPPIGDGTDEAVANAGEEEAITATATQEEAPEPGNMGVTEESVNPSVNDEESDGTVEEAKTPIVKYGEQPKKRKGRFKKGDEGSPF